ncbi:membrane protein insertion efficiency factor YidD [Nostoc sp.]|uniref:membrane protein insertion efficiency factor YidD n=1 Tax=Nostoc sp. TaxID=1180 RepID=UPI002FF546E9
MLNFITINLESTISHIIAILISQYQKYLSPLKGYSCPHRLLYGNESCSQYVKRTILEQD